MVMQIPRLSRIWFYTGVICDVSNRRLWRLGLWFAEINGWLQLYQKFPGGNLRKCLEIKPHIVCVCVCAHTHAYTCTTENYWNDAENASDFSYLVFKKSTCLINPTATDNERFQTCQRQPPPPPHIQSAQSSSHIPSGRHIHWHTQPYFHSYALVHLQSCMLSSVTLRGWGLSASGNYEWLLSD